MPSSIGVPVKLLHEAEGHKVVCMVLYIIPLAFVLR